MRSCQFVFLSGFVCGIFMPTTLGQMDVLISHGSNKSETHTSIPFRREEQSGTMDEDPDEDDVMSRLGHAESIEDFLSLVHHNGHTITRTELDDEPVSKDGRVVIGRGKRMANPDNCSPRFTTVRLTIDEDTDQNEIFFPRCTKIKRCGGCATSSNVECVPNHTREVQLYVIKGRLPFPGAPHLDFAGKVPVVVEQHVSCKVRCKLTAESCGPKKSFSRRRCSCKCKEVLPCPPPTVWDPEECTCKCPSVTECCTVPNCGLVWNPYSCHCDVSNDGRVVISSGGKNRALEPNAQNAGEQSTQDPQHTTLTTTSRTAIKSSDPCLSMTCPRRFDKVRMGDKCRCRLKKRTTTTTTTTTPTSSTTTAIQSATTPSLDPCLFVICPQRFAKVRIGAHQCRCRFSWRRWSRNRG